MCTKKKCPLSNRVVLWTGNEELNLYLYFITEKTLKYTVFVAKEWDISELWPFVGKTSRRCLPRGHIEHYIAGQSIRPLTILWQMDHGSLPNSRTKRLIIGPSARGYNYPFGNLPKGRQSLRTIGKGYWIHTLKFWPGGTVKLLKHLEWAILYIWGIFTDEFKCKKLLN